MVQIELLGALVDGVAQQGSDPHFLGESCGAQHRVLQQPRADTLAGPVSMHRQSTQDNHRNRIGHVAPDTAGNLLVQHRARSKGVVADDLVARTNDEGARGTFELILAGTLLEPEFKLWLAATEVVEPVRVAERYRFAEWGRLPYRSQGARLVSRRLKAPLALTGASRSLTKRAKRLASSANTVRSSST